MQKSFQGFILKSGIRHDAGNMDYSSTHSNHHEDKSYNATDKGGKSAMAQKVTYEAVCAFLSSLPKGTDRAGMVKQALKKFDISEAVASKYVDEHVKGQA
jgi:hypothetical protein